MFNPRFANAVRTMRQAQGLTQAQLADRASLSRTQIARIERGQSRTGPATYARLVNALGFAYGADLIAAAAEVTA